MRTDHAPRIASGADVSPSPGTPGEGWGEGDLANPVRRHCEQLVVEITRAAGGRNPPPPRPLPEYRAREDRRSLIPRTCHRFDRHSLQCSRSPERAHRATRERPAVDYRPQPIDTTQVELD